MSPTKVYVRYNIRTVFDARPFLPLMLLHITGPRDMNVWGLGVWRWFVRVR